MRNLCGTLQVTAVSCSILEITGSNECQLYSFRSVTIGLHPLRHAAPGIADA